MASIALGIDMLATAIVLGATVWFFFIQSPALFKSMGRERFVPLQMRLAVLFFKSVSLIVALLFVARRCIGWWWCSPCSCWEASSHTAWR